jgi:hypothetical protein
VCRELGKVGKHCYRFSQQLVTVPATAQQAGSILRVQTRNGESISGKKTNSKTKKTDCKKLSLIQSYKRKFMLNSESLTSVLKYKQRYFNLQIK